MLTVKSVADLNKEIATNLWKIDRAKYDVIVGIPRSGMIPASLLATHLQIPLSDVESFARGFAFARSGNVIASGPRILLVDDTSNKGMAMARAVERVTDRAASITRLAIYGPYREDKTVVDLYFADCPGPRVFQWNLWKHIRLPRWGFDFDGVFCRDPLKEENDDGSRYLSFMRNAEPMYSPLRPIGHIVTCRLEKYRGETIQQLRRYGIEYSSLTMMPYATKAERMAAGGRGEWKGGVAKQLGVEFFVESSPSQAKIIAQVAQIPVWCTSTQEVFR